MSMLSEFKAFAMRGNVVDMAIGIIIGAAFGKIVSSLVDDIIMPPIGLMVGGVDFTKLSITLKEAVPNVSEAVEINYGNFLQTSFDFLIVAFAIFLVIKGMNSMQQQEEAKPAEPPRQEVLLIEIRDLLKK